MEYEFRVVPGQIEGSGVYSSGTVDTESVGEALALVTDYAKTLDMAASTVLILGNRGRDILTSCSLDDNV
jgi:hypothetical protein